MKLDLPTIKIKITEKCNLECSYCIQAKRKNMLRELNDIHSLKRLFQQLPKKWIVSFTGGEPLFHPNFENIIQEVIKFNHYIKI